MASRVAAVDAPRRLPPDVTRILFVRNLPYKITAEEIYEIFGRFGAIRQVRDGKRRTPPFRIRVPRTRSALTPAARTFTAGPSGQHA
jgi:RNA recognition motif-containing protein